MAYSIPSLFRSVSPKLVSQRYAKKIGSSFLYERFLYFLLSTPDQLDIALIKDGYDFHLADIEGGRLHRSNNIRCIYSIIAALSQGSSIKIKHYEKVEPDAKKFCDQLALKCNAYVRANLYMTPAHNIALNPHFDTHDVLIYQMHGQKSWIIWDQPLGWLSSNFIRSNVSDEIEYFSSQSRPHYKFVLKEGEAIFMPSGYIHAAASKHCASLHCTLGFFWDKKIK